MFLKILCRDFSVLLGLGSEGEVEVSGNPSFYKEESTSHCYPFLVLALDHDAKPNTPPSTRSQQSKDSIWLQIIASECQFLRFFSLDTNVIGTQFVLISREWDT